MLKNNNTEKICIIVTALCVVVAMAVMFMENMGIQQADDKNSYVHKLFEEPSVHTIDIIVSEDDWQEMLDNASAKEYINVSMKINDELFTNIAIRPKGNSSLQQVASSDSDRYSFKIEFDHYDKTKTYYGLDKLALNNIIQDYSYMKDYLAYTIMAEMGVPSPLVNYVNLRVNGENVGLYLAAEVIEESFLQRNYGTTYGAVYKPESSSGMGGAGGMGGEMPSEDDLAQIFELIENFINSGQTDHELQAVVGQIEQLTGMDLSGLSVSDFLQMAEMATSMMGGMTQGGMTQGGMAQGDRTQGDRTQGGMAQGGRTQGGMGGTTGTTSVLSDALGYDGDDLSAYAYIFDNAAVTVNSSDQAKLIASIKQLNEGENLEQVLDIEGIIRYFVVHNFLINFDSYTGSIMHNYYLYEKNGVMAMLPWDYNLSFASFMTNYSTQALINFPIDTPVGSGTIESRPMLAWIFEDEKYTELYHEIFEEFLETMYYSGFMENLLTDTMQMIDFHVLADTTKFADYHSFTKGAAALIEVVNLRCESIAGQLNGTIPSTSAGQSAFPEALLDVGTLDITATGSTNSSGGGGGGGQQRPTNNQTTTQTEQPLTTEGGQQGMQGAQQDMQGAQQDMQGAQQGMQGGQQGDMQGGQQGMQGAQQGMQGAQQGMQGGQQDMQGAQQGMQGGQQGMQGAQQGMQGGQQGMQGAQQGMQGGPNASFNNSALSTNAQAQLIEVAVCIAILILAIIFLKFYKGRSTKL